MFPNDFGIYVIIVQSELEQQGTPRLQRTINSVNEMWSR